MHMIKKITILVSAMLVSLTLQAKQLSDSLRIYSYISSGTDTYQQGVNLDWWRSGIRKSFDSSVIGFQVDPVNEEITRAYAKKRLSFVKLADISDKLYLSVGKFLNPVGKLFAPPFALEAPTYPLMTKNYEMNNAGIDIETQITTKTGEARVNFSYWAYSQKYQFLLKFPFFHSASIAGFFQWGKENKKGAGMVLTFHEAIDVLTSKVGYSFNGGPLTYPFLKNKIRISKRATLINQIETNSSLKVKRVLTGVTLKLRKYTFLKIYKSFRKGEKDLWVTKFSLHL